MRVPGDDETGVDVGISLATAKPKVLLDRMPRVLAVMQDLFPLLHERLCEVLES